MIGNFNNRPQINYYDISAIARAGGSFNLCFNMGPAIDSNTPQLAMTAANAIQQSAQRNNNFLRVDMHNYLSENAFANQQFAEYVYVLAARLGYGMQAGEWQTMGNGINAVIENVGKAYAGAMALFDDNKAASISQNDQEMYNECLRCRDLWNYVSALAANKVEYVPFQKGAAFTAVPHSVQMNTTLDTSNYSSAFTQQREVAPQTDMPGQYNKGRYSKAYEKAFGTNRQLGETSPVQQQQAASSYAKPAGGFGLRFGQEEQKAPTQNFQPTSNNPNIKIQSAIGESEVNAFDKKFQEQDDRPLLVIKMSGRDVAIMRVAQNGKNNWKPSSLQPYIPAYCARTHRLEYFETKQDGIIAVAAALTPQQKEIAMDYNLHQVDPTMGKPATSVPLAPVREEAKILYATADQIKLNITVKPEIMMSDSIESTFKTANVLARRTNDSSDCMIAGTVVNTAVIFEDAEIAKDQLIVISAATRCKSIKDVGDVLVKIDDDALLSMIEENLATAITSVLHNELGLAEASVSGNIKSYSDDLEEGIRDAFSELVYEKFMSRVPSILASVLTAVSAEGNVDYANSVLTDPDQDVAPKELLERTIFIQQNVNIARMKYTDDEIAVKIPDNGAAILDDTTTAALNAVARAIYNPSAPLGPGLSHENYLLTSDNVRYRIYRGLLAANTYLISKA